jgi:hypothetical protein
MAINKDSTLAEIVTDPNAEDILHKHGVPCVTCPYAAQEMNSLTIGQVSKIYELDLPGILDDLNKKA